MAVLQVHEVEKRFRSVAAVQRLTFAVEPGEIFALLGPNGAGKTTTVRMIVGIIRPDRGSIGLDLGASTVGVGYLPEDRGLFKDIPILRTLTYFGVLQGMERRAARRSAEAWLDRLGLTERVGEKLDALSKGNQQKVQFISAVLHKPALAILDEPFSGLDPVNQDGFLEILRDLRRDGMTILLSAHQMQMVERIADRLLLIDRGREILAGTLEAIRAQADVGRRVSIEVERRVDGDVLAGVTGVREMRAVGRRIDVHLTEQGSLSEVLRVLCGAYDVRAVVSDQASLHDIYVRAVGRTDGGGEPCD